jgi:hypothetical protein
VSSVARRDIAELAKEFGCVVSTTSAGHVKLTHRTAGWSVFGSSSPSDQRALLNLRSDLRRKRAGIYR